MGGYRTAFCGIAGAVRVFAGRVHREGNPMVRSAARRPATRTATKRALAFATSGVLALSAAVGVAGTAQGAGSDTYTATVTPQVVDSAIAQKSFAVTITNSASNHDTLGSATIAIPGDFQNVSASVSASG